MNKIRLNVADIGKNSSNVTNILLSIAGWGLWASIYFPFPYALPIAIISILLALFSMNKTTLGLSLIFFIPHILAIAFSTMHIPIPPVFLCFGIASILLGMPFFLQKGIGEPLYKFTLLALVFFCWYLIGPHHEYSTTKIIYIVSFGFITIFAMKYFFERHDIQFTKIAILLGLISVTYIIIGIEVYHIGRPQGLFDISFIRDSYYSIVREDINMPVTYHSIGNTALIGMAFLLCQQQDRLKVGMRFQLLFFLVIIVILSQARQAFVGVIILFYMGIFLNGGRGGKRLIFTAIFSLLVVWGVSYIALNSDVFSSSIQASNVEEATNRSYDRALLMFKNNILMGTGLGGYSLTGERDYPHNILFELLSEMGIIGTFLVFSFTLFPFLFKIKRWTVPTVTGIFPIMLIIPYFIRSLSSSDLTENIIFLTMMIVFSQENDNVFLYQKNKTQIVQ